MINGFINVKPIITKAALDAVQAAAAEDSHTLLCPTHIVFRDGEIIGSMSVIAIPLVNIWAHSQKSNVRNTVEIINAARNIGRQKNNGLPVVTICAPISPISPLMPKLGFTKYGDTTIYLEDN
jgi:hypothetical protein